MFEHNIEKIEKLNANIDKYYYTIESRDYIHASTIVAAVYDIIDCSEITVNLRKIIKSGFVFDDIPSDDDFGFVIADNTILYLRATDDTIHSVITMSESQYQLYMLATLSVSMATLWGGKSKFWSRNLTVRPKWIINRNFGKCSTGIKITEDENDENLCCIDICISEVLVWRQDAIKSRKTV